MLFNLFSLYGNIEKIDKNPKLGAASVIYQSFHQMRMALKNLSNLTLFGLPLMIEILDTDNNILQYGSLSKNYVGFKDQRFKIPGSKNFKNMNAASPTLHLSNLPENYDLEKIKKIFSSVAHPLAITHFNESSSMALVCFDSIDSAIRIITTFHNYNILGRFLKVAFAKYKLNMVNSANTVTMSNENLSNSNNFSACNNFGNFGPSPGQGSGQMFGFQRNVNSYNGACENYMRGPPPPGDFGLGLSTNNNQNQSRKSSTNSDFTIENQNSPSLVHLGFLSNS